MKLVGCDSRVTAAKWVGADIAIEAAQLEPLGRGEYYWSQLIGLKVINLEGQHLGVVDHLVQTGANDVLVVKAERERLIPFVRGKVIAAVEIEDGYIRVDWDFDF